MREILFRGKRISNGEWVEGGIMKTFHPNFEHENEDAFLKQVPNCYCICAGGKDIFVDQESIGQFTGLTDKNGKKIFEGDIVRCISRTDMADMVVIFEDGEFRMVLCERYKDHIPGCGFYAIRCFDKEIIGNIHDNHELFEEDKQ